MSTCFELDKLSFEYTKNTPIFSEINLSFDFGSIIGILGENGSGKTTLFDIISGHLKVQKGQVNSIISKQEIAYIPQMIYLPPILKMKEIFEMIACFQGVSYSQANNLIEKYWSAEMLKRFNKIKARRSGICSYGEQRWLVICSTLVLCQKKKLFVIDEPTAGVDVQNRHLIWELIHRIKSDKKTIAVSSHFLDEIEKNSEYFYFLNRTKVDKYETMNNFIEHYGALNAEEAFIKATIIP